MKNISMFCLSLHPEHLDNLKKINYIPVGLGSNNFNSEWLRDNTKINISHKNKYYGEYSFHYWFWKNMIDGINEKEWIGFCAYRRYWSNSNNLTTQQLNRVINANNFRELVFKNIPESWNNYETILTESIPFDKIKLSKVIKNGGIYSIIKNFSSFIGESTTIKYHFDVFHGVGNIERAINLLENNEKNEFTEFLNKNSFNRENMFICRSKKIIKEYYKSVFTWLSKCEEVFGFNLNSWSEVRIYAFLAERYLSYWFNKNSNVKEWPFFFFDTHKNNLNLL
jgi:hypothetical protein